MSGAFRPSGVLHAPGEIAGQAAFAARGLRQLGVRSSSFSRPHPFGYGAAPDIVPGPTRVDWIRDAWRAVRDHDVIHLYFGNSFLPPVARGLDARAMRLSGRRVVVEFLGSDIRRPSFERARNPDYIQPDYEDDDRATATMRRWSAITGGHAIVCDRAQVPLLEPHFEHIHVVPFRIEVDRFVPAFPDPTVTRPRIVHTPSDLLMKGTAHVREAMDELRRRGVDFEYVEVHGRSNAEAIEETRKADLVIDQLCIGAHGVFAVEAWSMGKPVICNILPDIAPTYPEGFPMITATPRTLTEVLEDWLGRPEDRHELGRRSRAYAERVHHAPNVARTLLDVYRQLPVRRRG